jgi:hypothetical protein
MFGTRSHRDGRDPILGWHVVSGFWLWFGTQLNLQEGQRDAVCKHPVSGSLSVDYEKSCSMGIKLWRRIFLSFANVEVMSNL